MVNINPLANPSLPREANVSMEGIVYHQQSAVGFQPVSLSAMHTL